MNSTFAGVAFILIVITEVPFANYAILKESLSCVNHS
jgi:hypothetical protein